jgi:rRNA-processing arch domain
VLCHVQDVQVSKADEKKQKAEPQNHQVIVMMCINAKSKASGNPIPAPLDSPDAEMQPIPVPMHLIAAIGRDRLVLEKDLRNPGARRKVLASLKDLVLVRAGGVDAVPTLHPVKDLNVDDKAVVKALEEIEQIDAKLADNAVFQQEAAQESEVFEGMKQLALERAGLQVRQAPSLPSCTVLQPHCTAVIVVLQSESRGSPASAGVQLVGVAVRSKLLFQRRTTDTNTSDNLGALSGVQDALAQSLLGAFKEEVAKRRKVLRRLGHITDDGMLTVKGKAAAEV